MIDRAKLQSLHQREEARFVSEHPQSAALYQRAQDALLGGVPMNWMKKWAGPFPIFVQSAQGAHFTDVDGHTYIDLCLGDTGAMTGHSPEVVAEAVARRVKEGITLIGIYELKDDELKVCAQAVGTAKLKEREKERPKEFDSKQGVLVIPRRETK